MQFAHGERKRHHSHVLFAQYAGSCRKVHIVKLAYYLVYVFLVFYTEIHCIRVKGKKSEGKIGNNGNIFRLKEVMKLLKTFQNLVHHSCHLFILANNVRRRVLECLRGDVEYSNSFKMFPKRKFRTCVSLLLPRKLPEKAASNSLLSSGSVKGQMQLIQFDTNIPI